MAELAFRVRVVSDTGRGGSPERRESREFVLPFGGVLNSPNQGEKVPAAGEKRPQSGTERSLPLRQRKKIQALLRRRQVDWGAGKGMEV